MLPIDSNYRRVSTVSGERGPAPTPSQPVATADSPPPAGAATDHNSRVVAVARALAQANGLIVRVQSGSQGEPLTVLVVDPQTGRVVQEIGPHTPALAMSRLRTHTNRRLDQWA
jgi:hypothetical protein